MLENAVVVVAGDQHLLLLRQHNHGQLQQQGEGQGTQWHQHSQGMPNHTKFGKKSAVYSPPPPPTHQLFPISVEMKPNHTKCGKY